MTEEPLSKREVELINLVVTGASNKEISRQLHISVNTVKVHLRNIFTKLEVNSRTEAAMWAIQNGVVDTSGSLDDISLGGLDSLDEVTRNPIRQWFTNSSLHSRLIVFSVFGVILVILGIGVSQIVQSVREPDPNDEVISESDFEESRWRQLADMPTARAGLAAAAYDNHIYAIAGEGVYGVLDANERYDPQTDTWKVLTPKPLPVADVHAGVIGGKIYIPGGRLADGGVTSKLEIFDPWSGDWSQGAELPVGLSAYALATFEGKLYLFGGWDGEGVRDLVYVYDPDADSWTGSIPMPTARAYASAAEAGGRIFVIGGSDGTTIFDVNEVFTPAFQSEVDNNWTQRVQLPEGRQSVGLASLAGIIFVFGGESTCDLSFVMLNLPPNANQWQKSNSVILNSWKNLSVIPLSTNLYFIGGVLDDQFTSLSLEYNAIYSVLIPNLP